MPYATPFVLLTFEGVFGSAAAPVEQWRCTLKFGPVGTTLIPEADKAGFLADAEPLAVAFHSGQVNSGDQAVLVALTAAHVGTDGKYIGGGSQPTTRRTLASPAAGGSASNKPLSTALCLTLRTQILRGRGSAGRMYWPATAIPISPPRMTISGAQQDGIAGQAKTLLDGLNVAAFDAGFGDFTAVQVMSQLGNGVSGTVTRVEVGARLDSQERREKDVDEAYRGVDLAP